MPMSARSLPRKPTRSGDLLDLPDASRHAMQPHPNWWPVAVTCSVLVYCATWLSTETLPAYLAGRAAEARATTVQWVAERCGRNFEGSGLSFGEQIDHCLGFACTTWIAGGGDTIAGEGLWAGGLCREWENRRSQP